MTRKLNSQLTLGDRNIIARMLSENKSFSAIARVLGVSRSTISREVQRNRSPQPKMRTKASLASRCRHEAECDIRQLCKKAGCRYQCKRCRTHDCSKLCLHFLEMMCTKIMAAPYVCNGCNKKSLCDLRRYLYKSKEAQLKAEARRREVRLGIDATKEEITTMVDRVRMLSAQGQSLEHIWETHGECFPVSKRSFYRHIGEGRYDMKGIELPKRARYKPRKKCKILKADQIDFTGRRYADWEKLSEEDRVSTVQMDCMCGMRYDRKAILTLHFVRYHFQIPILLERHSSEYVIKALDYLEELSEGHFKEIFGILLTDRGFEFLNHQKIEHSKNRRKRCSVYYCDPSRSDQKGACEKNHVEIRKIIPKKTCFDELSTWDMADIASHVNSYKRASLGGKAPIDLAACVLPEGLLEGLGIRRIEPDEVNLTPGLLEGSGEA